MTNSSPEWVGLPYGTADSREQRGILGAERQRARDDAREPEKRGATVTELIAEWRSSPDSNDDAALASRINYAIFMGWLPFTNPAAEPPASQPSAEREAALPAWMTHRRMVDKCKDCGGPMLWQNESFRTLMCPNCVMERCEKAEAKVYELRKQAARDRPEAIAARLEKEGGK